jgi:FdhD protein
MTRAAGTSVDRSCEVAVLRVRHATGHQAPDLLAVEEPLEIRVHRAGMQDEGERSVAVTMRTPGNDFELAAGFLFNEGFLRRSGDLTGISYCPREDNVVRATLAVDNGHIAARGSDGRGDPLPASSSCGVCGKDSIAAVLATIPEPAKENDSPGPAVEVAVLHGLPDQLRRHQRTFAQTGGLHAAAWFNADGGLRLLREDIGRHNALDKLIGHALLAGALPMRDAVVLFSGRTGFELVQKAACAGIRFLAAVGAPSSLACELAAELGITLVGFLRDGRCNIYTGASRVTGIA